MTQTEWGIAWADDPRVLIGVGFTSEFQARECIDHAVNGGLVVVKRVNGRGEWEVV